MATISHQVIGCAMEVHRNLGCGFLEAVYERALAIEMRSRDIDYVRQLEIHVDYKGENVGNYVVDFLVGEKLILELKASSSISPTSEAQLLNYLKASGASVGLLLNFGAKSLQIKRMAVNQCPNKDIKKFV